MGKKKVEKCILSNKEFERNILLKIHRDFTKEEAFAFLEYELKNAKFKIGELTSENTELKDKNMQLLERLKRFKNFPVDADFEELRKENKQMKEIIKMYMKKYGASPH